MHHQPASQAAEPLHPLAAQDNHPRRVRPRAGPQGNDAYIPRAPGQRRQRRVQPAGAVDQRQMPARFQAAQAAIQPPGQPGGSFHPRHAPRRARRRIGAGGLQPGRIGQHQVEAAGGGVRHRAADIAPDRPRAVRETVAAGYFPPPAPRPPPRPPATPRRPPDCAPDSTARRPRFPPRRPADAPPAAPGRRRPAARRHPRRGGREAAGAASAARPERRPGWYQERPRAPGNFPAAPVLSSCFPLRAGTENRPAALDPQRGAS